MSDPEIIEYKINPRLLCDHPERTYSSRTGKSVCPDCDTCFSDNGDDIELRLQEFAKKLQDSQVDLPPEFQKVLDDNFEELLA